jgi:hypothetical protein
MSFIDKNARKAFWEVGMKWLRMFFYSLKVCETLLLRARMFCNWALLHMSGTCGTPMFPAGPLELQSALPNRVLEGGVCTAQLRTHFLVLLCGCGFAVRLEAIGCSLRSLPAWTSSQIGGALLASTRSAILEIKNNSLWPLQSHPCWFNFYWIWLVGSASRREKGPAR